MKKLIIHNKKELIEHRKKLRNNATPAEAHLWKHLKGRQLNGYKFRRQHSIFNYIVDFYCPLKKLVIELDGNFHYTLDGLIQDKERDNILKEIGITTVRFENKLVFEYTTEVLEIILNTLEEL
ncbi:endonuclease domain-containing protein [Aureivirga marina]|uniref:endonuclease domain-containing protein n=1 Tax=Aureivirga marina TaxID=1182451 RepID=UPI0018CB4832|nr:endonuclease domain-containing protein [Aureivirga marina]